MSAEPKPDDTVGDQLVPFGTRIPESLKEEIRDYAYHSKLTKQEIVTAALRKFFDANRLQTP